MSMICNRCSKAQPPGQQCLATRCCHLFCIDCAREVFASDTSCPVCSEVLGASTAKLIYVLNDDNEALDLALAGQTPAKVSQASQVAVDFYLEQASRSFKASERKIKGKMERMQQSCKQRMEELRKGYEGAKRKYQEAVSERNMMSQDLQELREKYGQKAIQANALSEKASKAEAENQELRARMGMSSHRQSGGGYQNQYPRHQPATSPCQNSRYPSPQGGAYQTSPVMSPGAGQMVPYTPMGEAAAPKGRYNTPLTTPRGGRPDAAAAGNQWQRQNQQHLQQSLQLPILGGPQVPPGRTPHHPSSYHGLEKPIPAGPSGRRVPHQQQGGLPGFPSSPSHMASM